MAFSLSGLYAQQLFCGQNPLTSCNGDIGIGGVNNGLNGASFRLTITHNTNYGGALYLTNTNPGVTAHALYAQSTNGVGVFATTTGVTAKSVYGLSSSGTAIFGESTGTGLAGKFIGHVEVSEDLSVKNATITENLETETLTAEAASGYQYGVAHFKAGANRQLFVVPNLGNGGFNYLSQPGDVGILFSDGLASGAQNQGAGLVLGPWTGAYPKGLRINADGYVGIGTANPITVLDVNGSLHVAHNFYLGVDQPTATFHMQGDFKLANPVTEENEFEINVDGEVKCRKVKVVTGLIADYVFEPDYPLPSLSEVESYIEEHKHLPGIQSQAAYDEIGTVDMGELQIDMLEKVEELFLYTLQLEKRIKELEAKLELSTKASTQND